ncbi:hypothetical protein QAD02_010381 [Eretmocerus hayati]|uniref:Uncharacterized protein n=1 Tax=Eretmocerus hayati TaxID=131215 RepID=A0ACC2ND58_9HYME|nr:hypothetical protein QAD02_010381 [Eretmocerus hayati]
MTAVVEAPQESPAVAPDLGRRNAVPIIYTRGTHYEIGFDIGRTFAKLIQDFVERYRPLQDSYLGMYERPEGRRIYEETLACANEQYPQYVREIQGTADGSGVPFYKLMLMHLDDIVTSGAAEEGESRTGNDQPVGCSSIICNHPGHEILGHNEDALSETLNHWYLVDAHVVEPGLREEKFTSLCYAGFLPGYTMGYNHHGLVYSINTLSAKQLRSAKTPRYFMARALLGCEDYAQVEATLRDEGYGAAEGFSVNLTFLGPSPRIFRNVEVAPALAEQSCSQIDVCCANEGDNLSHCNKYLRLKVTEVGGLIIDSSDHRMEAINRHSPPKTCQEVIEILSDQTDDYYRVYQEIRPEDYVKTIATGIFDCIARTWTIYTDKPVCNDPIVVLPLILKNEVRTCTSA